MADFYNVRRSISDLAQEWGTEPQTITKHLWWMTQAGKPLRRGGFLEISNLPPTVQEEVMASFAKIGVETLRLVYDLIEGRVSYDELHILRLHYVTAYPAGS